MATSVINKDFLNITYSALIRGVMVNVLVLNLSIQYATFRGSVLSVNRVITDTLAFYTLIRS